MLPELRPRVLYLNRLFIEKYAIKWRKIGLELNITSEALDIIEVDYPNKVQERCRVMLEKWLQKDPEASWEKLLHAVEITGKLCHSVTGKSLIRAYIYIIYTYRIVKNFGGKKVW